MKLLIVLLVLASAGMWITAVVQWFQHDDHAALGFMMTSFIIGSYANYAVRRYLGKRRVFFS